MASTSTAGASGGNSNGTVSPEIATAKETQEPHILPTKGTVQPQVVTHGLHLDRGSVRWQQQRDGLSRDRHGQGDSQTAHTANEGDRPAPSGDAWPPPRPRERPVATATGRGLPRSPRPRRLTNRTYCQRRGPSSPKW